MKALIIGTGAAGNKAVLEVAKSNEEVSMNDIVLVNSTRKDIPKGIPKEVTTIILTQDDAGCGKERNVAKEYTVDAIKSGTFNLINKASSYEIAIVVTSLEGGTGSGSAPIIADYCERVLGINTHLVGFTGFETDVRGLQNSIEFFQEIKDSITVQVIQNKAFLKKANNDHFRAEQLANKELARRISIMDGSLLMDSSHNIDTTDIYKVVNTRGYMTVEYIDVTDDLIDTSDFDKLCKKMIYESKSIKPVDPGQTRMAVILNLSPASEEAIDGNFKVLKDTYGIPYECFIHSQYDESLGEFIAFIGNGMSMPMDEVRAIFDRYQAQTARVNKKRDSFFDEVGSLTGVMDDENFDMGARHKRKGQTTEDFMSSYTTKPIEFEVKKKSK